MCNKFVFYAQSIDHEGHIRVTYHKLHSHMNQNYSETFIPRQTNLMSTVKVQFVACNCLKLLDRTDPPNTSALLTTTEVIFRSERVTKKEAIITFKKMYI